MSHAGLGRLRAHAVRLRLELYDLALGIGTFATPPALVDRQLFQIRLPPEAVDVKLGPRRIEMEHLVDDRVQELAVVADNHEPAAVSAEEMAQPRDRVGVEMVRRLVQDEGGGTREQHAGQLDPAPLTPGEGAEHLGEHPVGQSEAGGDRTGLGFGRPSPAELELLLEPGVAAEDPALVLGITLSHVGTCDLKLADDAVEAPGPEDSVAGDDVQVSGARILGKVGHRHGTADRAPSWESLPRENPGEGGLAGAIAPDEADPVPGRDLEGHRLEELATAGCEFDVGGGDHEGQS